MDFIGEVSKLAAYFNRYADYLETQYPNKRCERATAIGLVMPFLKMMGYSVFDLVPEYAVDTGGGRDSNVDFAIMQDGKPAILIECKSCTDTEFKPRYIRQLAKYFQYTPARIGILTDGITYRFFTDRKERNVMDLTPFFEFDFLHYTDLQTEQLKCFTKLNFDQAVA